MYRPREERVMEKQGPGDPEWESFALQLVQGHLDADPKLRVIAADSDLVHSAFKKGRLDKADHVIKTAKLLIESGHRFAQKPEINQALWSVFHRFENYQRTPGTDRMVIEQTLEDGLDPTSEGDLFNVIERMAQGAHCPFARSPI